MKKLLFLFLAVLIFCLVFTGCDNGTTDGGGGGNDINTDGELTITGLGAYNGYWVYAVEDPYSTPSHISSFAAFGSIDTMGPKCAKISGGKAVLKVWKIDDMIEDTEGNILYIDISSYTGSGIKKLFVSIQKVEMFPIPWNGSTRFDFGYISVPFVNGKGSGVFVP